MSLLERGLRGRAVYRVVLQGRLTSNENINKKKKRKYKSNKSRCNNKKKRKRDVEFNHLIKGDDFFSFCTMYTIQLPGFPCMSHSSTDTHFFLSF